MGIPGSRGTDPLQEGFLPREPADKGRILDRDRPVIILDREPSYREILPQASGMS